MDRTPYKEMAYYKQWKSAIGNVQRDSSKAGELNAGWSKVNITPSSPKPMAGYGNRHGKPFVSVHDSIYIRAMVIDNGNAGSYYSS